MEQQAFQIIQDRLYEELEQQAFAPAVPLADEEGKAVMFATDEVAYSLLYDNKRQRFEFRSATLDGDKKPGEWRRLALWLFDSEEGTKQDAESIANDFLEIVRGPKRIAAVQTAKKKKKGEESNVDPQFFYNRLVNIFPELKDDMNTERIVFGKVRFATMARAVIAPKCEAFAKTGGEDVIKLTNLFNDMYKDGDIEVRSIISHGIFNALSDEAMGKISENFSEELHKIYKCSRRLKDKNIKPEKPKKQNKVVAAALDNANRR